MKSLDEVEETGLWEILSLYLTEKKIKILPPFTIQLIFKTVLIKETVLPRCLLGFKEKNDNIHVRFTDWHTTYFDFKMSTKMS